MANSRRAVVIGGGLTGLSAAATLVERGVEVTLLESGTLGGECRTERVSGCIVERGTHFLRTSKAFEQLLWRLGLAAAVKRPAPSTPQGVFIDDQSQRLILSLGGAFGLLRHLPTKAVWRYLAARQAHAFAGDVSVSEFALGLFGSEFRERIVQPLSYGLWGAAADRLSSESYLPLSFSSQRTPAELWHEITATIRADDAVTVDGGSDSLVSRLIEFVSARGAILNERATGIFQHGNAGYTVQCLSGARMLCDIVVVAIESDPTSRLVHDLDPLLSAQLAQTPYTSTSVVHVMTSALPYRNRFFHSGFCASDCDYSFRAAVCDTTLFPHVAPERRELFRVLLPSRVDSATAPRLDRDLDRAFGVRLEAVLCSQSLRETIYPVGHSGVRALVSQCEKNNPGLCFVGRGFGSLGTSHRLDAALAKVSSVAQRLDAPTNSAITAA